ncbi:hypothetical protein BH10CHL1_BH10CHL1_22800 [soil metagenome]
MPLRRFSPINYFVLLGLLSCLVLIIVDRTDLFPPLRSLTTLLYGWTIILSGFALLLGVINVLLVHVRRIQSGQAGWPYSLALVAALVAVFVAGLLDTDGVRSPMLEWIFDSLIAPGQAMLFALTAFFMATAAFRWLRIGRVGGAWMLIGALLILLIQMPAANSALSPTWLRLANWTLNVPIMAIMRGALLGSGLALLIAGAHFLLSRNAA